MPLQSDDPAEVDALTHAQLRRWLHDVRQPLQQLSSALDLLALTVLDDPATPQEQREVIQLAMEAARRIEQKFHELDEYVHGSRTPPGQQ